MKDTSFIHTDEPNAHDDMYQMSFGFLHVEGGAVIQGKKMNITADDIQVDDGGYIRANNGGHLKQAGSGKGVAHTLGG